MPDAQNPAPTRARAEDSIAGANTEAQMIGTLKQVEAGRNAEDVALALRDRRERFNLQENSIARVAANYDL